MNMQSIPQALLGSGPSQNILDAISFCIEAHAGQNRREGQPYSSHPISVWLLMTNYVRTLPEATQIACLLHDVAEDTEFTLEDIQSRFGIEVASVVQELTNDGSIKSTFERKKKMIEKASSLSVRARFIKIFDRIHNLSSAVDSFSEKGLWHYVRESILLYTNLKNPIPTADPHAIEHLFSCMVLLRENIENVIKMNSDVAAYSFFDVSAPFDVTDQLTWEQCSASSVN